MTARNRRFLVLLTALAGAGCADPVAFTDPLPDDGTFPRGTATAEETRRFQLAADYSRDRGGLSVLVVRGQEALFEEQQNENAEATPHHLFSGTKSFSCALSVALAQEGRLSLDERVAGTVAAWAGDARKSKITVRQLLNFTSGLAQDWSDLTRDGLIAQRKVADKYALALGLAAEHEPGTYYEYGSSHLMAYGAFVKAKTGADPVALLSDRIFSRIGFRFAGWNRDPAGNPAMPYGAWTTAREWAKFGVLVRDRGTWRGTRVLDEKLLSECFQGSDTLPGYGLTFWLNKPIPAEKLDTADSPISETDGEDGPLFYRGAPDDLVVAAGYEDQRLYVMPSRELVVVRLGTGDRNWHDAEFLARLLDGKE